MRFNPNLDTGDILQIAVFCGGMLLGYSMLKENQAVQGTQIIQLRSDAANDRDRTDKQLTDIKADMRDISKGISSLQADVAVLRGRAASGEAAGKK